MKTINHLWAPVAAHPLLAAATRHIAHYQIRNRGTVGGSLALADPAAELPGVAVTCDAELTLIGPAGERVVAAADFFLGPMTTALAADEILTSVSFPAWPAGRRGCGGPKGPGDSRWGPMGPRR